MALTRYRMTHSDLVDQIMEWADEAENANRHDFCAALRDLAFKTHHLQPGDTFFGVVDFDELGDDRFALIEVKADE